MRRLNLALTLGALLAAGAAHASLADWTVTARQGAPAQFTLGGVTVKVSMVGNGVTSVSLKKGVLSAGIRRTTLATVVHIDASDRIWFDRILAEGPIGHIDAPGAGVHGELIVDGAIGKLTLGALVGEKGGSAWFTCRAADAPVTLQITAICDAYIRSLAPIGSLQAVQMETDTPAPNIVMAPAIGSVAVEGEIIGTRIMSETEIGSVHARGLIRSYLTAGMRPTLVGLPVMARDFLRAGRIGEVILAGAPGENPPLFEDSVISADTLGAISIGQIKTTSQMAAVGLAARIIQGPFEGVVMQTNGTSFGISETGLHGVGDTLRYGAFLAALFDAVGPGVPDSAAPPVPWNFCMIDDSRGGMVFNPLCPPGTAYWNLGPIMADAYRTGCALAFLPGDLISGINPNVHEQYSIFYGRTKFVPQGDNRRLPIFKRPGDQTAWAPYVTSDNFLPCRGNHECYFLGSITRTAWRDWFGQYLANPAKNTAVEYLSVGPLRNSAGIDERGMSYAARYGNSLFAVIDEYASPHDYDGEARIFKNYKTVPSVFCMDGSTWKMGDQTGPSQSGNWLKSMFTVYTGNSALFQHCYVFGHSPLYSTGDTEAQLGGDNGHVEERDAFVALMNGVADIYFCGHDHAWDHSTVKGTVGAKGYANLGALHQLLVGTGGANLDNATKFDGEFTDPRFLAGCEYAKVKTQVGAEMRNRHDNKHMGYARVTVDGQNVSVQWIAFTTNLNSYNHQVSGVDQAASSVVWKYGPHAAK